MSDLLDALAKFETAMLAIETLVVSNTTDLELVRAELGVIGARVAAIEERLGGADPSEEPTPLPEPAPETSSPPAWEAFEPEFDGPDRLAFMVFDPFPGHDRYTVAAMVANGEPTTSVLEDQKPLAPGLASFALHVPAIARFLRVAARDVSGKMLGRRDFPVPWPAIGDPSEVERDPTEPETPPLPAVAPPTLTKVDEGPSHADVRIDAPGADSIEYDTP